NRRSTGSGRPGSAAAATARAPVLRAPDRRGALAASPPAPALREAKLRRRRRPSASLALQLRDERQQGLVKSLGRNGADVLVTDAPVAIDHEGLRHAVDAEIDSDPARFIVANRSIGIAQFAQPLARVGGLVLVVDAIDRHPTLALQAQQDRVLRAAGHAPRR